MHTSPPGPFILLLVVVAYQMLEIWLVARHGRKEIRATRSDPEIRRTTVQLTVEVILAAAAAWFVTPLALPGDGWIPLVIGISVMLTGIAIRLWAVITLGRFFRPLVVLQDGHRVITTGPYRFVRHPSYTGILLVQVGLGIALGNLLSITICTAIPLFSVLPRIAAEEAALGAGLGEEYRSYSTHTSRLIPGVW